MNSYIAVKGINEKFSENNYPKIGYDLIFDCVDNFRTRLKINNFALRNRIPFISGGTDYRAGQCAVYVPRETCCIEHQLNLKELAEKEEERARQRCIYAPNPSVIMTNQIIAGFMLAEARTILDRKEYGNPINGVIKYNSNLDNRVGINFLDYICDCDKISRKSCIKTGTNNYFDL